jgi:hypothetical protein
VVDVLELLMKGLAHPLVASLWGAVNSSDWASTG